MPVSESGIPGSGISTSGIDAAVDVLRGGGLVAFPTETVYGLGADASNPAAVLAVFMAKGRPSGHPLIVHLGSMAQIDDWAVDIDPRARLLAARFWPGPLSLVLHRSTRVVDEVTGGRETVALRVPDQTVTLELLERFGGGLVGPSANRFGHVSPTTATHVLDDLEGRIDLILDGGPSRVGIESTIVEVLDGPVTVLRPGGVSEADLVEALDEPVIDGRGGESRAAGMLASHYAPRAAVSIMEPTELAGGVPVGDELPVGTVVISAGPVAHPGAIVLPADAEGFGTGLYAALRRADQRGPAHILIIPPSEGSLLPAVLDRLVKAAGPRS